MIKTAGFTFKFSAITPFKLSAMLITALWVFGCSDTSPHQTTLSVLNAAQINFSGRNVIVSGTLRSFDEPRHYWIENEKLERVALENVDNLAPKVGRIVQVRGLFKYDRDKGRRILVTRIDTAP